jgi:hypothetical protein
MGKRVQCLYQPVEYEVLLKCDMTVTSEKRGPISGRGKRFSLLQAVKTDCGAHPVSYPMDIGESVPLSKPAGA